MPSVLVAVAAGIHIAQRDDLHFGLAQEGVHVHRAPAAQADAAQRDPVARCGAVGAAERR